MKSSGVMPSSIKFSIAENDDHFHNLEENYDDIEIADLGTGDDEKKIPKSE